MTNPSGSELRRRPRHEIADKIDVNDGVPFRGGLLKDISSSGAAVVYPENTEGSGSELEMEDEICLSIRGRSSLNGSVVRKFEGGFAVKFDWSDEMESFRKD
jgi:hypothetical protein